MHLTRFVGREDEIERLREYVVEREARLVTIVGPGGIGKTRLVAELARRVEGDFAERPWFVELSGQMDGRKVDGNRIGRITMDGAITEFPIPTPGASPINIAVGPDRNVWFTKGGAVGRVTPDGTMTEFPLPQGVSGTGLTAGSDRQPPQRIGNRLWVAASGANRILYLEFK